MWKAIQLEMQETMCCSNTKVCQKGKQGQGSCAPPVKEAGLLKELSQLVAMADSLRGSATELVVGLEEALKEPASLEAQRASLTAVALWAVHTHARLGLFHRLSEAAYKKAILLQETF